MRYYIVISTCLFLFSACNQTEEKSEQQTGEPEHQIDSLLTQWHIAAAKANLKDYFDFMDSVSVYIGTDASEIWTKKDFKEFCEPYFEAGNTWSFKAIERNIYIGKSMETAWFDELLNTHMGLCRGSGVLEKSKDNWKLKQYVLSVAVPNEDMRAVVELKKANDSLYMRLNN